jgi:hypothetical protein
MNSLNQKTVASFLDDAAARADRIGKEPASGKQCWFLAKLIFDADDRATYSEFVNGGRALSKRQASSMIDGYLTAAKATA